MIELLKNRRNGYDNLYIRVDGGYPVQIKMTFFKANVFRFLLANAKPFEVERSINVAESDAQNAKKEDIEDVL